MEDSLAAALINMYGKCSRVDKAAAIFSRLRQQNFRMDILTWTSMISAYAKVHNFLIFN